MTGTVSQRRRTPHAVPAERTQPQPGSAPGRTPGVAPSPGAHASGSGLRHPDSGSDPDPDSGLDSSPDSGPGLALGLWLVLRLKL